MITINDLKIMNEALIKYYSDDKTKNEKKVLKHNIIKEILKMDKCFQKITEEEAINILKDIGIEEEKLQSVYQEVLRS